MMHQIVVGASAGDAITAEALLIRDLFRRVGPSEIYARHISPELDADIRPIEDLPLPGLAGPVLFHLSIGDPDVANRLVGDRYRVVVRYHNISPARYFVDHDPAFAALLAQGRDLLSTLSAVAPLAIAGSAFNARELVAAGYRDVVVVPIMSPWQGLRRTPPDAGTLYHLQAAVHGPVVLFVGQMLPHKRVDLLVQAFHLYTSYVEPDALLVVAGGGPPEVRSSIVQLVRELNLANVWITGKVPDDELASFFRSADVFATMSEHEGFCVPLVEAMSFDVPILGRDHAAIPETLAGAGVVAPSEAGAAFLAEAIAELVGNGVLRAQLTERGRIRSDDFRLEVCQLELLQALEAVV